MEVVLPQHAVVVREPRGRVHVDVEVLTTSDGVQDVRIVQVKRAGRIVTSVFDATVP